MQAVFDLLKNLIAPPLCGGCKKFGTFLCVSCHEQLCYFDLSLEIADFSDQKYIDSITAGVEYNDVSRSIVRTIKYEGVYDLATRVGELLYESVVTPQVDCIAPVPLHPRRQRVRGFNQTEAITKALSTASKTPWFPLLVRTKYTIPQAQITDRSQRLARLKGIFQVSPKVPVGQFPAKILLIDDVVTTGATLNECARVLKMAGVQQVHALAFAHGG